jgi:hypothetical protein
MITYFLVVFYLHLCLVNPKFLVKNLLHFKHSNLSFSLVQFFRCATGGYRTLHIFKSYTKFLSNPKPYFYPILNLIFIKSYTKFLSNPTPNFYRTLHIFKSYTKFLSNPTPNFYQILHRFPQIRKLCEGN